MNKKGTVMDLQIISGKKTANEVALLNAMKNLLKVKAVDVVDWQKYNKIL